MKLLLAILLLLAISASPAVAQSSSSLITAELPWWGWALLLFVFTLFLGVIAVIGGVGGGVLFVPIVSAVFPFHFDFIRGAGLLVALCGALSAAPYLLRTGLASMRLGLPMALFGSVGSIIGAAIGLSLPIGIVETLLGVTILGIVVIMVSASRSDFPVIEKPDPLGAMFGIRGSYLDKSLGTTVEWRVHRTALALMSYVLIGVLGGMFGLGAGWANVPALNLLLGAPIKVAVATSGFIMTLNSTAATWVYVNNAAILPLIAAPSIAGMMIGTRIGARVLPQVRARSIRWVVIGLMVLTGLRSLVAGIIEVIG